LIHIKKLKRKWYKRIIDKLGTSMSIERAIE